MSTAAPSPSPEYLRIGALPARELEAIMRRGEPPDPAALAGWEWRGLNTMAWAPLAGIKKFVKGFYRSSAGRVLGYNIPIAQDAITLPWRARPSEAHPKRFGHFLVTEPDAASSDNAFLNSLLLDYGRGPNPFFDPSAGLRDYLVRIERGSDELLLGTAYFAAGPLRLRVPRAYFVLERRRPTDFTR
ncbi:MAG: hypothetical protein EXR73_09415 [Myxococcales bacterium]|nr:hypothetical protein [Myxococcales bacterium]